LEYVLYYREGKTISIEKYILIVSSTNPKIGIVRLKIRLTVLCAISQNSSMELTIFLVFIKCSD
jgi:hypothetical protein